MLLCLQSSTSVSLRLCHHDNLQLGSSPHFNLNPDFDTPSLLASTIILSYSTLIILAILDFIFVTYKTYKYDGNLFVSWLGETAAKCNLFPSMKSTGKVKPGNKKKPKNQTNYTIASKVYVPLAKKIISQRIAVPSSTVRGLQRVIEKRRKCSA